MQGVGSPSSSLRGTQQDLLFWTEYESPDLFNPTAFGSRRNIERAARGDVGTGTKTEKGGRPQKGWVAAARRTIAAEDLAKYI